MDYLKRGQTLYQREGGLALAKRGLQLLSSTLRKKFQNIRWEAKAKIGNGYKRVSINETELRFHAETGEEVRRYETLVGERPLLEDLHSELRADDVFWDIGANTGLCTCVGASVANEVFAFEPGPMNAKRVRQNLELNGLDGHVQEIALGDTHTEVSLQIDYNMAGGVHSITQDQKEDSTTVKQRTGDEVIESGDIEAPTVMILDVEGAEASVLRGLETTLSDRDCRVIYVEVHPDKLPDFGDDDSEIVRDLESIGYDVEKVLHRFEDNYHIKAVVSN